MKNDIIIHSRYFWLKRGILWTGAICSSAALPILLIAKTGPTLTQCQRLEPGYATCQQTPTYFYGLLRGAPREEFRLEGTTVELDIRTDSDDHEYEVYQVFLLSDRDSFLYDEFGNSEQADAVSETLDLFRRGAGSPKQTHAEIEPGTKIVSTAIAIVLGVVGWGLISNWFGLRAQ